MTSVREAVRQRLRRGASPLDPAVSYRIHWTGVARTWDPARRRRIMEAVRAQTSGPDFEPTARQRRFSVRELDDQAHAGSNLLCLIEVLEAFPETDSEGGLGGAQPPA